MPRGFAPAKRFFFDRPAVRRLIDRPTARFLVRYGGFVRTVARRSIRKRKAVSRPGTPPTDRTGKLKRGIFFSFDAKRRSVVIGPTRSAGTEHRGRLPRTLEEGGRLPGPDGRSRRFAPRPFMGPAQEKGLDRRRQFWRQSIAA
ncbi:MAG: hypothetical protein AAGG38_13460 [Planctomycetota bacterium]